MKRIGLILIAVLLGTLSNIVAQSINLSGKVVDSQSDPISEVKVTLESKAISTSTNNSGEFNINNVGIDTRDTQPDVYYDGKAIYFSSTGQTHIYIYESSGRLIEKISPSSWHSGKYFFYPSAYLPEADIKMYLVTVISESGMHSFKVLNMESRQFEKGIMYADNSRIQPNLLFPSLKSSSSFEVYNDVDKLIFEHESYETKELSISSYSQSFGNIALFKLIPLIQLSTSNLTFTATSGEAAPASQFANITNGGSGTLTGLSYSFEDGKPTWLFITIEEGTAPTVLKASVSMLDPFGNYYGGTLTDRIKITSTNASNSPQYIDVTFTIQPPASLTAYASHDNGLMTSDLDANIAKKVFSNSEIGVGVDYYWLIYGGYNYSYAASAIKFNIQSQIAGRNIASATLRIYTYALRGDFTINPKIKVSAFYNDWNPSTLNYSIWENMQIYNQGQVEEFAPSNSVLPLDFDVTTIVRNWASGDWNNYGFSLSPLGHSYPNGYSYQTTFFQSLEKYNSLDQRPQLIIEYQ